MINRLRRLFEDRQGRAESADGRHAHDELHLAAASLLVEAAMLDGVFDDAERAAIDGALRRRFKLNDEEVADLMARADKVVAKSVQFFGYTHVIKNAFDEAERIELMDMLWEVVYADGALHDLEASLMRRVAGLIYVSDQDSGRSRKRALARSGRSGDEQ